TVELGTPKVIHSNPLLCRLGGPAVERQGSSFPPPRHWFTSPRFVPPADPSGALWGGQASATPPPWLSPDASEAESSCEINAYAPQESHVAWAEGLAGGGGCPRALERGKWLIASIQAPTPSSGSAASCTPRRPRLGSSRMGSAASPPPQPGREGPRASRCFSGRPAWLARKPPEGPRRWISVSGLNNRGGDAPSEGAGAQLPHSGPGNPLHLPAPSPQNSTSVLSGFNLNLLAAIHPPTASRHSHRTFTAFTGSDLSELAGQQLKKEQKGFSYLGELVSNDRCSHPQRHVLKMEGEGTAAVACGSCAMFAILPKVLSPSIRSDHGLQFLEDGLLASDGLHLTTGCVYL
ncbi:Uncharacterized protein PODLI_1B008873, partial [Podarcis lilfordi]